MNIVPILVLVAVVILAMYFVLNRSSEVKLREGLVKDILRKDALSIDFGEGRAVVVKLVGVTPAAEAEMLDEKIFELLNDTLRGHRVSVKPVAVQSADVMTAEVRTLGGEYVNAVLVRQGFARWHASEASGDSELAEAQEAAKAAQVGVWNPAIIQLIEDRRISSEAAELSDDDIANMDVDPEEQERKE